MPGARLKGERATFRYGRVWGEGDHSTEPAQERTVLKHRSLRAKSSLSMIIHHMGLVKDLARLMGGVGMKVQVGVHCSGGREVSPKLLLKNFHEITGSAQGVLHKFCSVQRSRVRVLGKLKVVVSLESLTVGRLKG